LKRGSIVSDISRAIAAARARASLAFRDWARLAEYTRFAGVADRAFADLVDVVRVCASAGEVPEQMRPTSASGPIQKSVFLFT
jgi:hypothetical protein